MIGPKKEQHSFWSMFPWFPLLQFSVFLLFPSFCSAMLTARGLGKYNEIMSAWNTFSFLLSMYTQGIHECDITFTALSAFTAAHQEASRMKYTQGKCCEYSLINLQLTDSWNRKTCRALMQESLNHWINCSK